MNRRPHLMIAALLALLGFLDAAFLTINHYLPSSSLVCPLGSGCETVQTSRWSTLPFDGQGLPVALIGVFGYLALMAVALLALEHRRLGPLDLATTLVALAVVGFACSLVFVGLQLFVIRALCFWCMLSAGLETAILIVVLLGRFNRSSHPAQSHPARVS